MRMSIEHIRAAIDAQGRCHTLEFRPRTLLEGTLFSEIDRFVESINDNEPEWIKFQGLGERWDEINEATAGTIICRILEFDLAYSSYREMDEAEAMAIRDLFLAMFDDKVRFFTNGTFTNYGWSGNSVAGATFETGVIAVDSQNIGMLWCHDED